MYSIVRTEENGGRDYLATTKSIKYFREELKPFFVATDIESFEEADDIERGFRNAEKTRVKNINREKKLFNWSEYL